MPPVNKRCQNYAFDPNVLLPVPSAAEQQPKAKINTECPFF